MKPEGIPHVNLSYPLKRMRLAMKLRYIIALAVSIYALFAVVACGNKSSNNDVVTVTCPSGTAYYNAGYCYGPNGQIVGNYSNGLIVNQDSAYVAFTRPPTQNVYGVNNNFSLQGGNSTLSITNSAVFLDYLQKAHGVCNRAHINGGQANCNAWLNVPFEIRMRSFANQNNATQLFFSVKADPYTMPKYYYQLPSLGQLAAGVFGYPDYSNEIGAMMEDFSVQGVTSLINNSQGFEIRAYGHYQTVANRSLIQIQVTRGKILDNPLNFKLFFEGKQMAAGAFVRVQ